MRLTIFHFTLRQGDHSATANQSCPSSSALARHSKFAIAAADCAIEGTGARGVPRQPTVPANHFSISYRFLILSVY
ncbi:MAG: hypothetical protein JO283_17250 [Bradyrhizobium sp.]|nr:hypothetical protein [Bradyrhizobium sp.]